VHSRCKNGSRDGEEVMCEGKSFHFHIHAPATGKARRPTVESLTAGTDRLLEVRSLCRDGMSVVGVNDEGTAEHHS